MVFATARLLLAVMWSRLFLVECIINFFICVDVILIQNIVNHATDGLINFSFHTKYYVLQILFIKYSPYRSRQGSSWRRMRNLNLSPLPPPSGCASPSAAPSSPPMRSIAAIGPWIIPISFSFFAIQSINLFNFILRLFQDLSADIINRIVLTEEWFTEAFTRLIRSVNISISFSSVKWVTIEDKIILNIFLQFL